MKQVTEVRLHAPSSFIGVCKRIDFGLYLTKIDWSLLGASSAASLFNEANQNELGTYMPPTLQSSTRLSTIHGALSNTTSWKHPVLARGMDLAGQRPLPPWLESLALVNHYFETFNDYIPIFDHPSFLALLGQHFLGNPCKHPAWWACINTVIAISLRDKDERSANGRTSDAVWQHIRNALDVILDISIYDITVTSIQATTVLTRFFLGTRNPQPAFVFSGTSIRMCHAIGLHEVPPETSGESNLTRAKRLAYCTAAALESHISFRSGRPSACDTSQIHYPRALHNAEIPKPNQLFWLLLDISVLRAKVLQTLYTPVAKSKPASELASLSLSLLEELEQWKHNLPQIPSCKTETEVAEHLFRTRIAILHLAFLDCKISAGFRVWHDWYRKNSRTSPVNTQMIGEEVTLRKVADECMQAARASCKVLHLIPVAADHSLLLLLLT